MRLLTKERLILINNIFEKQKLAYIQFVIILEDTRGKLQNPILTFKKYQWAGDIHKEYYIEERFIENEKIIFTDNFESFLKQFEEDRFLFNDSFLYDLI